MAANSGQQGLLSDVAPMLTSQYHVLELLGEGGMGQVYKAEHRITGQQVAVKVLRRELLSDQVFRTRFLREAQVLSKFDHPSITHLFNFIEEADGSLYLIMQYVSGPTLEELIERVGPLPSPVVATLTHLILEAFQYAHERGVVHRDIKPSNIVLPSDGGVKVMDFGIARVAKGVRITTTGDSLGSPGYMAPEQVTGGEIDARCDIYSLGVLLFEMVTGDLPFLGESGYVVMKAHVEQSPPDPRDLVSSVDAGIAEAILWAMKKVPEERPQSVDELDRSIPTAESLGSSDEASWEYLLEQLEPFCGAGPGTGPVRLPSRPRRPLRDLTKTTDLTEDELDIQSTLPPPVHGPGTPPRSSPLSALVVISVLIAIGGIFVVKQLGKEDALRPEGGRLNTGLGPIDIPTVMHVPDGEMVYIPSRGLKGDIYIDRTEVTYNQYRAFLEDCPYGSSCGPRRPIPALQLPGVELIDVVDHAVGQVTHADAERYCKWTNKRLPTSEEWTRAATGEDNWTFPWGNDPGLDDIWIAAPVAKVKDRPGELPTISVHDVQYYRDKSPYGVMGMGGNVSEWLADEDPQDRNLRLIAGGSWSTYDIEHEARCTDRSGRAPDVASSSIGFRCAMDAPLALKVGTAPLLYEIRKAGKIRIGTELASRPMIYEENNKQIGFEKELMDYLAESLGVSLEIAPVMYPDLPAKLRAGRIDLIVSGYTPDISYRGLLWSNSYLEYGLCMLVSRASGIQSIDDLDGKSVGHYTDAATHRAVTALAPRAKRVVSYENRYMDDLRNRRLDAFLYDFPFAQAELNAYRHKEDLTIAQFGLTDATYNVGIPAGEWSLAREVNLAINTLRSSDHYVELVRKYLGGAPPITDVPPGARATLVQPGDTLRTLAKRELGDEERWSDIWELNRSRLGNQNLLYVGAPVLLPHE